MAIAYENTDRFERLTRYLSGELNDSEAAQFEGDWANNAAWTKELELDARVQAGLSELKRSGQIETAMRGPWWVQSFRLMTLAASVAAIGVAIWAWQHTAPVRSTLLARTPSLELGDSVAIMRLRQASPVSGVVELPLEARSIELRVMPDVTDAPANELYAMSLAPTAATGASVVSLLDGLSVGKDGFVRAYVDSSQLAPGRYRLALRRAGSRDANTQGDDEFLLDVRSYAATRSAD